jgi:hypothetical protein
VVSDKQGHVKLMLNAQLTERQRTLAFSREVGYYLLGLKERSYTFSWTDVDSFEEILNNFRATYFAGALLVPQHKLVEDLREFMNWETWDPNRFVGMIERYNVSPELFMHRMVSLLPRYFGMQKLFYLRMNHVPSNDTFRLTKELHLSGQHPPHGSVHNEHYCRRWISISVIKQLLHQLKDGSYSKPICGAQISTYMDSKDQYFCISVARNLFPTPDANCSMTIGFAFDEEFKRNVRFWNSPNVPTRQVNGTCERCASAECRDRVASPIGLESRRRKELIKGALEAIKEL